MQLLYTLKGALVLAALVSWSTTTAHPLPPSIDFRANIELVETTSGEKAIYRIIPRPLTHLVNEAYKFCKHLSTNEAILRCCAERMPLAGFCLRSAKQKLKLCADTPEHVPSDVEECLSYKCV